MPPIPPDDVASLWDFSLRQYARAGVADASTLPRDFIITAESEDGTIMGIEHTKEPVAAVQFHPESIMTLGGDAGMRMIENVVEKLAKRKKVKAA